MEGTGTLRTTITIIIAAITLSFAAATAHADNYGGVSRTEKNRVIALIHRYFGNGQVGACFVNIANRESGFNRFAVNWNDSHANGRGSFGIFQIGRIHIARVGGDYRRLYDAETNVRVARDLYRSSGVSPWRSC